MNTSFDWENKRELRKSCSFLRDSMNPLQKEEADRAICRRILALSCYRFAPSVLLYYPIKSEINILPVIEDALKRGKTVALPLCEKEPGVMTFRKITSLAELAAGTFGVPEPSEDAPALQKELTDPKSFIIVPALAFDKSGYRLGYGKGYYDRFLGGFKGTSAGVVYQNLIFKQLPKGFFDRRVQLLVSEGGVKPIDA